MVVAICVFSILVILFVSQSARAGRVYLSGPIVFLVAGGVIGTQLAPDAWHEAIRTIAEVTLVLVLFHDAAELQPRELRIDSAFTLRLLLVGMPLTVGAGFVIARGLFPEIGVWLALLLAASLAPTDAGLGAATVLNPVVPARVRRILNVESGLNDGLATPVVLFAVAAAAGAAEGEAGHGLLGAVAELIVGALVGAVVGYLCGRLIQRSRDLGWADQGVLPIATLAVPLLCYYGATELGGNGFIAAFVAGTAFAASQSTAADVHHRMGLTELTSTFLSYAVWMLFGLVTVANLSPLFTLKNLTFAALSLTLIRMVPVALSLLGSGLRPRTMTFVGWFGPRGLASVIFALIAVESLEAEPGIETVLGVIASTVGLSVLAHGLTASPWARRYGAWAKRTQPPIEMTTSVEPQHHHGSPVVLAESRKGPSQ